jgi:hypothetical protein
MANFEAFLFTLALTALPVLPAFGAANLLRCQPKDAVHVEDGTLKKDWYAETAMGSSYNFIADLSTGMVRYGDRENTLTVFGSCLFSDLDVELICIDGSNFFRYHGVIVWSGTCEPIE